MLAITQNGRTIIRKRTKSGKVLTIYQDELTRSIDLINSVNPDRKNMPENDYKYFLDKHIKNRVEEIMSLIKISAMLKILKGDYDETEKINGKNEITG